MNLRNQYKRLFEGRVSSNDAKLLREAMSTADRKKREQIFNYVFEYSNLSAREAGTIADAAINGEFKNKPVNYIFDYIFDIGTGITAKEAGNIARAIHDGMFESIDINEGTWSLGSPKHIGEMINSLQAIIKMADDAQNRPNAAGRGFVNALQNQLKDEGWNQRLYKILGDDSFHDAYDVAKAAAEVRDFDKVKIALGDAIGIAEKIKSYMEANIKR